MARADTLLTGSIMTLIAMALMFDDDENGSTPPSNDDTLDAGGEETDPDGAKE